MEQFFKYKKQLNQSCNKYRPPRLFAETIRERYRGFGFAGDPSWCVSGAVPLPLSGGACRLDRRDVPGGNGRVCFGLKEELHGRLYLSTHRNSPHTDSVGRSCFRITRSVTYLVHRGMPLLVQSCVALCGCHLPKDQLVVASSKPRRNPITTATPTTQKL
jgi:hypothetical protein